MDRTDRWYRLALALGAVAVFVVFVVMALSIATASAKAVDVVTLGRAFAVTGHTGDGQWYSPTERYQQYNETKAVFGAHASEWLDSDNEGPYRATSSQDGASIAASCRYVFTIGYRRYGKSRTGLRINKKRMWVRYGHNGRGSICRPTFSHSSVGEVCCWGSPGGWHLRSSSQPRAIYAQCNNYNGIYRHNCLVKYSYLWEQRFRIDLPYFDEHIGWRRDCISIRYYPDHARGGGC